MSAFLFFSQTKRRAIKDANPGMRNTEISRVLGEMWQKASHEERAPHIEREAAERQKYKVAIAKWREEEAERRKKEAEEKKVKAAERQSVGEKGQSSQKPASSRRDSPVPLPGTSPLPIHHSRPASPGPMQGYYHRGSYGYPVPNYGAPPPTQYNPYGPYQQQPSPQNAYYRNYASMPPPDYQSRRQYHDYPSVPQSGSMEEARHYDHSVPPHHYSSYYPPNVSHNTEHIPESLPMSSSNEVEHSNDFSPPA